MSYLSHDALETMDAHAFRHRPPFLWSNPRGLLTEEGFLALRELLPDAARFERVFGKTGRHGQQRHDGWPGSIRPAWRFHRPTRGSWRSCRAPDYRRFLARTVGTRDFTQQFHWHSMPQSCSVSPHCEAKHELPGGVRLVTLRPEPKLRARLRLARLYPRDIGALARPVLLPWWPAPMQRYVADLARYLASVRPAALLAAKTYTNLLALWAQRLSGAPVRIVTCEYSQLFRAAAASRKWRWRHITPLVARGYRWANAIVAVSDGVADDLVRTADLPRERITTIYNLVVTPELHARAEAPPPHPWLADGGWPVIVAAGRLGRRRISRCVLGVAATGGEIAATAGGVSE